MSDIWSSILNIMQTKINQHSYNTWFLPTKLYSFDNKKLIIEVPNQFFKKWLSDQYLVYIEEILSSLMYTNIDIEFIVSSNITDNKLFPMIPTIHPENQKIEPHYSFQLNPKYTFETFVKGDSNQFAYAAAKAVAEHPSLTYNPLFIYGGVGLGKTHLVHAIGHTILENLPNLNMIYIQSEKFTNELINAIRYDRMNQFRDKYRNMDILLIDDIQFIAGKERTEEEFFHTFNTLFESRKQIVITSDAPPKNIPTIEERLRSRFEWGLIADIQCPDLETKVAILLKKADLSNIQLSNEVAFYIAKNIKSNIRELEGCLTKLAAFSSINKCPITMELSSEVLADLFTAESNSINIDIIQKTVCKSFNIKLSDLKSKCRSRENSYPRQIAMYLCRKLTKESLPKIGRSFGGKDHTTVVHAYKKIEKLLEDDFDLRHTISKITSQITNY
ncbi:MAG: chromosomal replication initiator protein DnaA [bacterium]